MVNQIFLILGLYLLEQTFLAHLVNKQIQQRQAYLDFLLLTIRRGKVYSRIQASLNKNKEDLFSGM